MDFDKKKIKKLAAKHQLKLLVLFGSQAKGKKHAQSDLDLAFYPSFEVDEEKLYEELVHLFQRADIDLINLRRNHNHLLRYQALSQGLTLYEAEFGLKNKMEWQSYFDYMDFSRYYRQISKIIEKKLKMMAV